MTLMGDFSRGGGGVHKTDGFWWVLNFFLLFRKIKRPGRLFRQIRYLISQEWLSQIQSNSFCFVYARLFDTVNQSKPKLDPSSLTIHTESILRKLSLYDGWSVSFFHSTSEKNEQISLVVNNVIQLPSILNPMPDLNARTQRYMKKTVFNGQLTAHNSLFTFSVI